jgi:hypothetical protein
MAAIMGGAQATDKRLALRTAVLPNYDRSGEKGTTMELTTTTWVSVDGVPTLSSELDIPSVPPAGFEPATHGLGNRCSIP